MSTWDELFPQGRTVFYEGDDPAGFKGEMTALGVQLDPERYNAESGWCFDIPAGRVEEIYGNEIYRLGS